MRRKAQNDEAPTQNVSALDAAADALYAAPLEEFVERRTALAKSLRQAGASDEAKQLAAMAKPSLSAWAVNRLWWSERAAFTALFEAATSLRRDPDARRGYDAAVGRLREGARELLTATGHAPTPVLLRRVTRTLQALAAIGSFAPDAPGRLVADREPPGFEAMEGASWASRDDAAVPEPSHHAPRTVEKPHRGGHDERRAEERRRAEEQRRAQEEHRARLRHELASLRVELAQHEGAAGRAAHALEQIAAKEEKLRAERRDAEATRARAEKEAAQARARIASLEASLSER